ncbi:MAG: AAA family ATPase [Candidatus ainarchaeum sp.]|nr:AAA family ATPase [Candidatus ainarchaeum sp.]MDD3975706.1 AAA family ATPase [Candidatus ainarchaeum sp.]
MPLDWNVVLSQNPWFSGKKDPDIDNLSKNKYIITRDSINLTPGTINLIKGPRRVGKTIYLKQIAYSTNSKEVIYFNFDILLNLKEKELFRQMEKIINLYPIKIILFDEIQSLQNSCAFLKALKDSNLLKDICLVVTGSDPRKIEECKQALIGRSEEIKVMSSLTFRQFLLNITKTDNLSLYNLLVKSEINLNLSNEDILSKFLNIESYFDEINKYFNIYLLTGGFPETINSYFKNNSISEKYYEDIIQKIFEKMDKTKSIEILKVLIESLTGSLKYTTISEKTGYSIDTIKKYLNELKELLIIFEIKESARDLLKKFYIKDPFIIHSLLNYSNNLDSFEESRSLLFNDTFLGKLVENTVGSHLQNIYNLELKYYNVDQKEIDFVFKNKAIEVKYRNKFKKPNFIEDVDEYIMLSKNLVAPADINLNNNLVIPVCMFLAMLEKPKSFL